MTLWKIFLQALTLIGVASIANGATCGPPNPCVGQGIVKLLHDDPGRYISCAHDRCHDMACPGGLHFNIVAGYCDYPANIPVAVTDPCAGVTCVEGTCTAGVCNCNPGFTGATCSDPDPDVIPCPEPNPCLGNGLSPPGYLAFPYDVFRFIQCSNWGDCFVKKCPERTYWNATKNACDQLQFLDCPYSLWDIFRQEYGICLINEPGASNFMTCEGSVAMSMDNGQPHAPTSEALHSAFLGATPHIKELSRPALVQNIALQECRQNNQLLTCPQFLSQLDTLCTSPETVIVECPYDVLTCDINEPYRTINGSCNNIANPLYGSAARAHKRFMPPDYSDCVNAPRAKADGSALPSARVISNEVFDSADPGTSHVITAIQVVFGQIHDHDLVETPVATLQNPCTGKLESISCGDDFCRTTGPENRECFPINNPPGDDLYDTPNPRKPCGQFVRSEQVPNNDCAKGPRQQANLITSFVDCSFVYGSEDEVAHELRTFIDGKMKVQEHPDRTAHPDFLPLLPEFDDEMCRATPPNRCVMAGDLRQNEMASLTALHTLYVRYHNHIVEELKQNHLTDPTYDDEKLYQEARKIVIGVNQNIIGNEYQPSVLGIEFMTAFDLGTGAVGSPYFPGYDPSVDATCSNVLAAAALRYGHTQLNEFTRFAPPDLNPNEIVEVALTRLFFNPDRLYASGVRGGDVSGVNAVIIGMTNATGGKMDTELTDQIRGSLFTETPTFGQGMDLAALNIQRARDLGIPSYVRWRQFCNNQFTSRGLPNFVMNIPANDTDFAALSDNIPAGKLANLQAVYSSVHDIDLFPGALSEDPVTGGLIGATFSCIVALDFRSKKFGDRFYFERQEHGFTPAQLDNIRNQTLSSLLCATLEDTPGDPTLELNFQDQAMILPRAEAIQNLQANGAHDNRIAAYMAFYDGIGANTRKPCAQHPSLDFTLF